MSRVTAPPLGPAGGCWPGRGGEGSGLGSPGIFGTDGSVVVVVMTAVEDGTVGDSRSGPTVADGCSPIAVHAAETSRVVASRVEATRIGTLPGDLIASSSHFSAHSARWGHRRVTFP